MYRGHRIGVAVPAYNEEALIGETHTRKGLYPSAGVKTLAWYLRPGRRGVSIVDIRDGDPAIAFKDWLGWVQGMTGFFAEYETMPAISTQEANQMIRTKAKK